MSMAVAEDEPLRRRRPLRSTRFGIAVFVVEAIGMGVVPFLLGTDIDPPDLGVVHVRASGDASCTGPFVVGAPLLLPWPWPLVEGT